MEVATLRIAVETCQERHGLYGLSFWGDNGLTLDEIATLAGLPQSRVRVSTVGVLRSAGLEPVRSGRHPHLTIKWGTSPTDDELESLARLFSEDVPNPALED